MPYSSLKDKKNQLIRKARDGSVFIAPSTSNVITAITAGAGSDLQALPAGYEDLGWISSDGASFGRETEQSDVTSFGSVEPTRSDVTKDTMTMQVTAQETKLLTLGLYSGADLTAVTADAVTKEYQIEKPSVPAFKYYRVLGLFVDYDADGLEIYLARFMPRARITELAEQQFSDGDEPITYQMTFTGFEDSTAGYSHKWFYGGPGWSALVSDMGIS